MPWIKIYIWWVQLGWLSLEFFNREWLCVHFRGKIFFNALACIMWFEIKTVVTLPEYFLGVISVHSIPITLHNVCVLLCFVVVSLPTILRPLKKIMLVEYNITNVAIWATHTINLRLLRHLAIQEITHNKRTLETIIKANRYCDENDSIAAIVLNATFWLVRLASCYLIDNSTCCSIACSVPLTMGQ